MSYASSTSSTAALAEIADDPKIRRRCNAHLRLRAMRDVGGTMGYDRPRFVARTLFATFSGPILAHAATRTWSSATQPCIHSARLEQYRYAKAEGQVPEMTDSLLRVVEVASIIVEAGK